MPYSRKLWRNFLPLAPSPRRFAAAVGVLALWMLGTGSSALLAGSQEVAPKAEAKPPATATLPATDPARGAITSASKENIRVRVEVVNVPVTVLDKRGLPVIDLKQKDFEIYEDGKPQTIRYFSRETRVPLRVGLILDTSNSARRQLPFQKDAASEFVFNMLQGRRSKNQIFLQTFDATSSIIQDFTNDPELLNEKLRPLKAGGGKALYDAIHFACKEKMMIKAGSTGETRRVLVLISDGLDVQSEHSLEEVIALARKAETAIYAIGNAAYGFSNPGDKILQKLVEETGGSAFFPLEASPGADVATGYFSHGQIGDTSQNKGLGAQTGIYSSQRLIQLADALEKIGRELNEQYYLGYTPTNPELDGRYRTIRVVALRKGLQIRSRPGYYASAE